MLFTYEELQNYISLNAEDENTDRMLLTSSYNTLKKILNFELEERNYTELHTVTDYKVKFRVLSRIYKKGVNL